MRVIKPNRVREYGKQHKDAESALLDWLRIARHASWQNIQEVRQIYPSADAAKVKSKRTVIVFNLCGPRYRLIVAVHFNKGTIYVLRFMTHAEYSKNKWKDRL